MAAMGLRLNRVPPLESAAEVAREARQSWGLRPASRLDLDRLCDRLGIEISVLSMGVPDGGAQGFLIPSKGGGFRIEIDPEPVAGWDNVSPPLRKMLERHRTRFLVAHELSHTLFFEDRPDGARRVVFDSPRQEAFCDELARSLLVPQDAAKAFPFSPEGIVELQRRFDVSMEVALRGAVAARAEAGAAWLLIRRGGETLVQWTSAERSFTARALRALHKLAALAFHDRHAKGTLVRGKAQAQALYLPRRGQVLITCSPA